MPDKAHATQREVHSQNPNRAKASEPSLKTYQKKKKKITKKSTSKNKMVEQVPAAEEGLEDQEDAAQVGEEEVRDEAVVPESEPLYVARSSVDDDAQPEQVPNEALKPWYTTDPNIGHSCGEQLNVAELAKKNTSIKRKDPEDEGLETHEPAKV